MAGAGAGGLALGYSRAELAGEIAARERQLRSLEEERERQLAETASERALQLERAAVEVARLRSELLREARLSQAQDARLASQAHELAGLQVAVPQLRAELAEERASAAAAREAIKAQLGRDLAALNGEARGLRSSLQLAEERMQAALVSEAALRAEAKSRAEDAAAHLGVSHAYALVSLEAVVAALSAALSAERDERSRFSGEAQRREQELEVRLADAAREAEVLRGGRGALEADAGAANTRWLQTQREALDVLGRFDDLVTQRDALAAQFSQQTSSHREDVERRTAAAGRHLREAEQALADDRAHHGAQLARVAAEAAAAHRAAKEERLAVGRRYASECQELLERSVRKFRDEEVELRGRARAETELAERRASAAEAQVKHRALAEVAEARRGGEKAEKAVEKAGVAWRSAEEQMARVARGLGDELRAEHQHVVHEVSSGVILRAECAQLRGGADAAEARISQAEASLGRVRLELQCEIAEHSRLHALGIGGHPVHEHGDYIQIPGDPLLAEPGLGLDADFGDSIFTGDEGPASMPASPAMGSTLGGGRGGGGLAAASSPTAERPAPAAAGEVALTSDVLDLRQQLDRCRGWFATMRQGAEEANAEIRRLKARDALLSETETERMRLQLQVTQLQADALRLEVEKRKLMELNNGLKSQLVHSGCSGALPGSQEPLVERAKLEEERRKREEAVEKVERLEALVHRLTAQSRAYRAELDRSGNAGALGGSGRPPSSSGIDGIGPGIGGLGDAAAGRCGSASLALGVEGRALATSSLHHAPAQAPGGRGAGQPQQASDRATEGQLRSRLRDMQQRGQRIDEENTRLRRGVLQRHTSQERRAASGNASSADDRRAAAAERWGWGRSAAGGAVSGGEGSAGGEE